MTLRKGVKRGYWLSFKWEFKPASQPAPISIQSGNESHIGNGVGYRGNESHIGECIVRVAQDPPSWIQGDLRGGVAPPSPYDQIKNLFDWWFSQQQQQCRSVLGVRRNMPRWRVLLVMSHGIAAGNARNFTGKTATEKNVVPLRSRISTLHVARVGRIY